MPTSYDLLIVTDATASMRSCEYWLMISLPIPNPSTDLTSLRTSIPEILALSKLSGAFSRLGIIAYKDYSDREDEIVAWSGWNVDLEEFTSNLMPTGGGDFPEAAKSALIRALAEIDEPNTQTIVLWYTDAPPHHPFIYSRNGAAEIKAFPEGATDWVRLCHSARNKNCTVFCFTPNVDDEHSAFYVLLSQLTGGLFVASGHTANSSTDISRLTLDVILQWMGQTSEMRSPYHETFIRYFSKSPLEANPQPFDESDGSQGYLPPSLHVKNATRLLDISHEEFQFASVPAGPLASSPLNLGKKFSNRDDEQYRAQVYTSLSAIIESNISALTYNPVFGQLWRAVCKETDNDEKTKLLDAFSMQVSKLTDPAKKTSMQQWLEDSYDASEEIEDIIASVGTDGRMVYLDLDANIELTRIELLEVSRSCYAAVLKKIASIFTHLKVCYFLLTLFRAI